MPLALDPHFLKRFFGMLASALAIYVVFLAVLVLGQERLMYFPDSTVFVPEDYQLKNFTRLDYLTADSMAVHGFYAPPEQGRRLTLVFFQGNAGHLGMRVHKIKAWRDQGYGVMLATYRGFHGNKGFPSEEGLYADARAGLGALREKGVRPEDMVFYGESLGTGIAVQMASEGQGTAGVILETPYTSIPDVGEYRYPFMPIFWIMRDKFNSLAKIKNVHVPLLILKAAHDHTVPPVFAEKLFAAANELKYIVSNPDADHNTVYNRADVVADIFLFLTRLKPNE